jgi:hypothetical protein
LDSQGRPHIAWSQLNYGDATESREGWARWTGEAWDIIFISEESSPPLSKVLDPDEFSFALNSWDLLHTCFYSHFGRGDLGLSAHQTRHRWHDGNQAYIESIPQGVASGSHHFSAMVCDQWNTLHFVYNDASRGELRYAQKVNTTEWETPEVIKNMDAYLECAGICIDEQDFPHILYVDSGQHGGPETIGYYTLEWEWRHFEIHSGMYPRTGTVSRVSYPVIDDLGHMHCLLTIDGNSGGERAGTYYYFMNDAGPVYRQLDTEYSQHLAIEIGPKGIIHYSRAVPYDLYNCNLIYGTYNPLCVDDPGKAFSVEISPNLASNYLLIEFTGLKPAKANVMIYDLSGRLVDNDRIESVKDHYRFKIDSLSQGIYYCMISGEEWSTASKFIRID